MSTVVSIPSHWVTGRTDVLKLSSWTSAGPYTIESVEHCQEDPGNCSPELIKVTLSETLDATQKTDLSDALIAELNEITFD